MPEIGQTLSHFRIVGKIGQGGMGEVYLADDTTLDRKVALKFLPDAFTSDPERMARFEREAKLLASLNHSNIAGIYGLEQADGNRFLVLEYVEGETLQARLSKGALPLEDALALCRQIAEGLEAAHEKGVIHRDLKPANVMITAEEKVKILDFGLAKAFSDDTQSIDSSQSPTLTEAMTRPGVILGTAAYMSPEQAKGKSVDKRADIWAFGCILYECLTGKRAFEGETVTETLAAVLRGEPDWLALSAKTPQNIQFVLHRCLEKERNRRLKDAADIRILLDELHNIGNVTQTYKERRSWVWISIAVLFVGAFCAMAFLYFLEKPLIINNPVRFQIDLPENVSLSATRALALSPDGKFLAFAASGPDRICRVWLHAFANNKARYLPGTESQWITALFWSPDSRFIAYNDSDGRLTKIDINSEHLEPICNVSSLPRGGSWNDDDEIIYGGLRPAGITRVSVKNRTTSPVTIPDPEKKEKTHLFPIFLSDGRHFLYHCVSELPGKSGIYVGSLDLKPKEQNSQQVLATDYSAVYIPSEGSYIGHLLFISKNQLWIEPFDEKQLKPVGEPTRLSDQVSAWLGGGLFSASTNGVIVYGDFVDQKAQLTWFDRRGNILKTIEGDGFESLGIDLFKDDSKVAVSWIQDKSAEIEWIDLTSGKKEPLTFGGNENGDPIWSPDGKKIIFASDRNGPYDLFQKPVSGIKNEEPLFHSSEFKIPSSWSSDGKFLLYGRENTKGNEDLFVLPLEDKDEPYPFADKDYNEGAGSISPDMRWIAYTSDETEILEVYVREFSPSSTRSANEEKRIWPISKGGGSVPKWKEDSKELYYQTLDGKVMVVEITDDKEFRYEKRPLFQIPLLGNSRDSWDVSSDGTRFLIVTNKEGKLQSGLNVILYWPSLLEQ